MATTAHTVVVASLEVGPDGVLLVDPPGVAEPELRHDVERSGLGPAVGGGDLDADVVRVVLGELHEDVPVAVLLEDSGVEQLVLELGLGATSVHRHQVAVGEGGLRILVEHLGVGVGRRAVEVEVVLLDVLAVVPLAVGEAEHPLLEDRVLAVPEAEREAEQHVVVAEPGDAVLAAQVGARAGLVVRDVVPGLDVLVHVLPNAAPLPLAEVGPPLSPGDLLGANLLEAGVLARDVGLAHRWVLLSSRATCGFEARDNRW